jgi:hypothetical protein
LKAHQHLTCENLTPFVGIFLAADALGVQGLDTPGKVFVGARAVHFLAAILNPPLLRSVAHFTGFLATMSAAVKFYQAYQLINDPNDAEQSLAIVVAMCAFTHMMWPPYVLGKMLTNGVIKCAARPVRVIPNEVALTNSSETKCQTNLI